MVFEMKIWKGQDSRQNFRQKSSLVRALAIAWIGLNLFPTGDMAIAAAFPSLVASPAATRQTASSLPPQISERIRKDLERRTGEAGDRFQVKLATAQTWPDGCLGLARPGEFCTQALVKGWRVVMSLKQKQWVYRSNRQGTVIRFETAEAKKNAL